jgi:multiple sugar transport system substrate-binding protein
MPSKPGIVQAINPRMNVREVMALAPVPVPTGRPKVTATWFAMRVISSSAKDPEAAWKVYKAFYSKETQLRNFKIAAVLSTRLDVRSAPEVQNDKFAKIYSAQTPYVKLEPLIPEWPKIGDAVITAIQEALTGIKTPEQALKDAHIATNRALGIQ